MKTKIESLLFASTKPLSAKSLANFLIKQNIQTDEKQVLAVIKELQTQFNIEDSGINLIESNGHYQMVTSPKQSALVKVFLKEDQTGELTQPSLETLTIIAYRGPVSKPAIEQIRGVNCSLILRNLLIRGLISEEEKNAELFYSVTTDFLKFLGLTSVNELPDYAKLHEVENLEQFLNKQVN